jgi:hypothetical protein
VSPKWRPPSSSLQLGEVRTTSPPDRAIGRLLADATLGFVGPWHAERAWAKMSTSAKPRNPDFMTDPYCRRARKIADTSSNSRFQVVVLRPTVTSDSSFRIAKGEYSALSSLLNVGRLSRRDYRTIDEGIIRCRAVIAVTWRGCWRRSGRALQAFAHRRAHRACRRPAAAAIIPRIPVASTSPTVREGSLHRNL